MLPHVYGLIKDVYAERVAGGGFSWELTACLCRRVQLDNCSIACDLELQPGAALCSFESDGQDSRLSLLCSAMLRHLIS